MYKPALLLMMLMLTSCASFGKGVTEAILENSEKQDTRKCEVRGDRFKGIEAAFAKGTTVKIMMIHGVGTHEPGYAARIRDNLSEALNLTVQSKRPKKITLINPADGKTEIGNLSATRLQSEDGTKDLIFYELTWSSITTPEKAILRYDVSGNYTHKRAAFNNSMKTFLNDVVPDPMVYLLDKDGLILNATKQATCWMMGKSWKELKYNQKAVCSISSYQQVQHLSNENNIFITHSLGSRILMDSLVDIVESVSQVDGKLPPQQQQIVDDLKNRELIIFMLANQLPLLQIARQKPNVRNQVPSYCRPKGKNYRHRVFKRVNVVAFSDPNDLLSYDIPQEFVDDNIDSRMCPNVTNVSLNVAEVISAFGVGVVNPVTAHTEYDNDERVIQMISKGMADYKNNPALSERCTFTKLGAQ